MFKTSMYETVYVTNARRFLRQKIDLCYVEQINSPCLSQYRPFLCRPTNFVSVAPNFIFFCVGGRLFFLLNQTLNSSSNNYWSSFDHRQTVCYMYATCMSVVSRSTFKNFLNVGRETPIVDRKSTESLFDDFNKSADEWPTILGLW